MEEQMLSYVAQFGMAGLMGLLWILERRHSSQRERELSEAHTRILEQREELSELIAVVRDNTTAMTSLVQQQTHLTLICEQVAASLRDQHRIEIQGSNQGRTSPAQVDRT